MLQINRPVESATRSWEWATYLRIALGGILIWKGINFIRETGILEFLTNESVARIFIKSEAVVLLAAALLTLVFGIFIMAGLFTRIAAFLQLPIYLIGMLFLHGGYVNRTGFELLLTIVVPFLLLLFITKGSDAHVDKYAFKRTVRRDTTFTTAQ